MEIEHVVAGSGAKIGDPIQLDSENWNGLTLQRADYLMTDFALQAKSDERWIQSADLASYMSLGEGRSTARLGFVAPMEFKAIRFRVGVNPILNATDPNQFPAGHALNPIVNDLHWGWAGGYIFLALEGSDSSGKAFSYHLANDGNAPLVTIPVEFDTTQDNTIKLEFDIASVLTAIDPNNDGHSSHSRDGDPVAEKISKAVAKAFRLSSVQHQSFQQTPPRERLAGKAQVGTPLALPITDRFPKVTLPEDNLPTVEGVALGKSLFFDKRLSKGETLSCASCHDPRHAFSDRGQIVSIGAEGIAGKRNSQPLFNLAWQDSFFWDGRAKTLREQVLMPITDKLEMNTDLDSVIEKLSADESSRKQFTAAFGTPEPTADRMARALEQYLLTLVSQDSKFDRAVRGEEEFTAEEKRGLELFVTEFDPSRGLRGADCFHCHGGNLFTSRRFSNNGLDAEYSDLGRFDVTGDPIDIGKFKVPSLRNIAVTGPYMHDGRFDTLEEVVDHYDHGVQRSATLDPNLAKHPSSGLGLSADDKRALIAFLETLTDTQFLSRETS